MTTISIDDTEVGEGHPTFLIAEIGQAHDGSLGMAHSFIDAVADTGVDAIKFQTHLARHESTRDEPFRVDFSYEDETRFDYWERMEFTRDQWQGLAEHARDQGLIFLSSTFCKEGVDLLQSIDVPAWKVGSGEYKSNELIEYMAKTGLPVLLSTGMSTYEEIDRLTNIIQDVGAPCALFQCTSKYPTSLEDVGLNVISEFSKRYDCPVGLSDHQGSIYPGMAAIGRGIDLLEIHVTFDRRMFGPDSEASVTLEELSTLVEMRDAVHEMDQNPIDKDRLAEELSETRDLFSKSIAPVKELESGTVLTADLIAPKKPATGIPYDKKDQVIGATLLNNVRATQLLSWEDLDV